MAEFDIGRASLKHPDFFQRFTVTGTGTALKGLGLNKKKSLLVFQRNAERRALIRDQMLYHHAAQGELAGKPYLISFWGICNSGVGLTPIINGSVHHFSAGGLYNGLILFIDDETHSYWDHITGECVHGELAGARMSNWGIEMTTVEGALEREPELRVLVSKPTLIGRLMVWMDPIMRGRLPPGFRKTMAESDSRLPEMEMGLGVVTETRQRFYRMSDIRNGINDILEDRNLSITIGDDDGVPNAVWEDDSRPLQLFTRWYGFSLTYPGCHVYETA